MFKALGNWWTTLTGLIGAIAVYMSSVGAKPPETKQEWASFFVGLTIAILGAFAKDGRTGSPPGATS